MKHSRAVSPNQRQFKEPAAERNWTGVCFWIKRGNTAQVSKGKQAEPQKTQSELHMWLQLTSSRVSFWIYPLKKKSISAACKVNQTTYYFLADRFRSNVFLLTLIWFCAQFCLCMQIEAICTTLVFVVFRWTSNCFSAILIHFPWNIWLFVSAHGFKKTQLFFWTCSFWWINTVYLFV